MIKVNFEEGSSYKRNRTLSPNWKKKKTFKNSLVVESDSLKLQKPKFLTKTIDYSQLTFEKFSDPYPKQPSPSQIINNWFQTKSQKSSPHKISNSSQDSCEKGRKKSSITQALYPQNKRIKSSSRRKKSCFETIAELEIGEIKISERPLTARQKGEKEDRINTASKMRRKTLKVKELKMNSQKTHFDQLNLMVSPW